MGKVMQESIKKIGEKLICDDYMISMTIGKNAAEMFEIENSVSTNVSELSISIQPKFEQDRRRSRGEEGKREMRGSMEMTLRRNK